MAMTDEKKDLSALANAVNQYQSKPVMQEVKTDAGIVGKGSGTFGTSTGKNTGANTGSATGGKAILQNLTNYIRDNNINVNGPTAYQQNLQKTQPKQVTLRSTLSDIYKINQTDPAKAAESMGMLSQLMRDPTSMFYNPYADATNQAVKNLESMGIDCSNIDENWLKQNSWLKEYYTYSGTTNTPSAPGKKASAYEQAAYQYWQIEKAYGDTTSAQQEWEALQEELAYKANNPYTNLSDDEIVDSIDWSKYKTLRRINESLYEPGNAIVELNTGIGYSHDAMYGAIWAARNGSTGNAYRDMANSYDGVGNTWKDNETLRGMLTPGTPTFSKYAAGMTLYDEGLYFGVYEFTPEVIEDIRKNLDWNDETAVKYFNNVLDAEEKTEQAEKQLARLQEKLDKKISRKDDPQEVIDWLERELKETGEDGYDLLVKMDKSLERNDKFLATTRAINYRKQDLIQYIKDSYEKKNTTSWDEAIESDNTKETTNAPKEVVFDVPEAVDDDWEKAPTPKGEQKEAPKVKTVQDILDEADEGRGASGSLPQGAMVVGGAGTSDIGRSINSKEYEERLTKERREAYDAKYGEGAFDRDMQAAMAAEGKTQAGLAATPGSNPPKSNSVLSETEKAQDQQAIKNMDGMEDTIANKGTSAENAAFDTGKTAYYDTAVDSFKKDAPLRLSTAANKQVESYWGNVGVIYNYNQNKDRRDTLSKELEEITPELEELSKKKEVSDISGNATPEQKERILVLRSPESRTQDAEWGITYDILQENPDDEYGLKQLYYQVTGEPAFAQSLEEEEAKQAQARQWWDIINDNSDIQTGYMTPEEMDRYEKLSNQKKRIENEINDLNASIENGASDYNKAMRDRDNTIKTWAVLASQDPNVDPNLLQNLDYLYAAAQTEVSVDYPTDNLVDLYVQEGLIPRDQAVTQAKSIFTTDLQAADRLKTSLDQLDAAGIPVPEEYRKNILANEEMLRKEARRVSYVMLDGAADFQDQAERVRKLVKTDSTPTGGSEYDEVTRCIADQDRLDYKILEDDRNEDLQYVISMTDEEKNRYLYLYGKEGEASARKYFDYIKEDVLNRRRSEDYYNRMYEFAKLNPITAVAATGASFLTNISGGIASTTYEVSQKLQGKQINPYDKAFDASNVTSAARAGTKERITNDLGGEGSVGAAVGNLLYDGFVSSVDSYLNAQMMDGLFSAAGSLFGATRLGQFFDRISKTKELVTDGGTIFGGGNAEKIGKWLGSGSASARVGNFLIKAGTDLAHASSMGAAAAANTYRDYILKYGPEKEEQAIKMAVATFFAETGSEAITVGNLHEAFGKGKEAANEGLKEFLIEFFKNGAEEALGEGANEWVTQWAEKNIMGMDSKYYEIAQGYIDEGYSETVAYMMADQDLWKDILYSAATGFISSGFGTAAEYAGGYMEYRAEQRNEKKNEKAEAAPNVQPISKERQAEIKKLDGMWKNLQKARGEYESEEGKAWDKYQKVVDESENNPDLSAADKTKIQGEAYAEYEKTKEELSSNVDKLNAEYQEFHDKVYTAEETATEETAEEATAEAATEAVTEEAAEAVTEETAEEVAEEATEEEAEETIAETEDIERPAPPSPAEAAESEGRKLLNGLDAFRKDFASLAVAKSMDRTGSSAAITSIIEDVVGPKAAKAASQKIVSEIAEGDTALASEIMQEILLAAPGDSTYVKEAVAQATMTNGAGNAALMNVVSKIKTNSGTVTRVDVNAIVDGIEADMKTDPAGFDASYQAAVKDARIADKVMDIVKKGDITKDIKAAQSKVDQAQEKVDQANENLETAQNNLEKAQSDVKIAADELKTAVEQQLQDAQNDALNAPVQRAGAKLEAAVVVENQQTQAVEAAQANVEQAEQEKAAARKEKSDVEDKALSDARSEAEAAVGQEMQQEAEQIAEEARKAAEVQRQRAAAQAADDVRTGKAREDAIRRYAEEKADARGLTGEERDVFVRALLNRAEQTGITGEGLNTPIQLDEEGKVTNAEGVLALGSLERKLGLSIRFEDMGDPTIVRGKYKGGVVTLNSNLIKNGSYTTGQALIEVALHEITHAFEETKSYKKYASVVKGILFGSKNATYENNSKLKAAVDQMMEERKRAGHPVTKAEALNEVIADFARTDLADRNTVERFMDAGLGGQMRNALHNINQALRNHFSNLAPEERVKAENLRRAERAYQKALTELAKSEIHPEKESMSISQFAQATGMTFDEKKLELRDKYGNVIDGVKNKITSDMMNETPVGMLIDKGLTGTQNADAKEMMAGLMNMIARYRNSDLVWEIGASTLSSTFSALKSNSDPQYKDTVDFGTVCAKTQAIIDVMSQVMLNKIDPKTGNIREGVDPGLTREEIMKVYDATHDAGLSVPCPVCYVFSRWMGVPSLLGQMSKYQHDYVVTKADGSIDTAKTQAKVDEYIKNAEKYGTAKDINNKKARLQSQLTALENQRKNAATKEARKEIVAKMVEIDKQIGEVSAYNWITQALCKKENGKFVVDPKFKLTPDEILFDLNRTGEFAGYAKNWAYRNTRGAGMGKAIMPYSGETIGDILYGVKKGGRQSAIKNPWLTMDPKAAEKQLKYARDRAAKQNLVGGQRLQSTSDFRPEWGLDYIMTFLELQAAGSKVQMYTKVADAVDLFASVGADVNLSIMGKGTGWREATAEEIEAMSPKQREEATLNGKVYVLEFSNITGMDYGTAVNLKNKYDNVQMILVGMNDTHIRLAMANSDIDFIIPWHSSGNSKEVLAGLIRSVGEKLDSSVDYTTTQTDMVKGTVKKYTNEKGEKVEYKVPGEQTEAEKLLWNARMKIIMGKANTLTLEERTAAYANPFLKDLYHRFYEDKNSDCYGVRLSKDQASQIFPYEYWQTDPTKRGGTKDTADENGKRFVEYCEAMGIVPRFSQFKDDPGYWKLLIDRPMYNNDGSYHQQKVIDVTGAKIGSLNEAGELIDSDLPTKAQAKYAPRDPRSEHYAEYTEMEKNAIERAEASIMEPYDDGSEGQNSVYSSGITDADIDKMLAEGIKSANLLNEIGVDTDRIARQIGQQNDIYDILSGWVGGEKKSVDEIKELFGGKMYPALKQWIHNTYQKGVYKKTPSTEPIISKDEIVAFLENDERRIKEGLASLTTGWKNLVETHPTIDVMDVSGALVTEGKVTERINSIVSDTLGKKKAVDCENEDSKMLIRIDDQSIQESFSYSRNHGIPFSVTEKILRNAAPLLKKAVYIGSRIDYFNSDKNVHYFVSAANADNNKTQSTVLFSVHESVDPLQNYSHRAYVTEIDVLNQKEGDTGSPHADGYTGVTPDWPSNTVSITDVLNSVNIDRIRFFDKESISGEKKQDILDDEQYSAGIGTTDADLDQMLAEGGFITRPDQYSNPLEGQNPALTSAAPGPQRQFGQGMLQDSDEIADEAKRYVLSQNSYVADTNADQLDRAIQWIRSNKTIPDSDGLYESILKINSKDFDYRSADGQARMVAVMGMAVAKNDVMAQIQLADAFNRQGTDLGRAMQARKLFRLMTPAGRISTLQKMLQNTQEELSSRGRNIDLKFSDWIYRAAAIAADEGDYEKVYQAAANELAEQIPVSWSDKIVAWRMLSMLGNPRTHIRNIVGNAMFIPMVTMKNKIGAVGEIVGGVKRGERTKTIGFASSEARSFAKEYVNNVSSELRGDAKYDDRNAVKQAQKTFGTGKGILSKTLGKALQAASDTNSKFLEFEDWVFLKGHFQRALSGYMTANKLTAADMKGATLEKATQYAINEAQKATYRDANSVASALNNFSKKYKGTKAEAGAAALQFAFDAILPFKKTPANILRRGFEYSIFGVGSALYDLKSMVQTSRYMKDPSLPAPKRYVTPSQFIDKLASGLTGTAVMYLGAVLASMGAANAGLDDKDPEDKLKKLQGEQEYGVNFGKALNALTRSIAGVELFGEDVTYTMDWAAPFSMPFFVGVALEKQLEKEHGEDEDYVGTALESILGITEPVFNLSMLDGINSLFKVSSNDPMNPATQIGMKVLLNYGSSFVPTLLGQVARTKDPVRRANFVKTGSKPYQVFSTLEQIQNKIPGLSEKNIPYRNEFGEAQMNGSALENFFSPGYMKGIRKDKIITELTDVYNNMTQEHGNLLPEKLPQYFKVGQETIRMEDYQYDKFQQDVGETYASLMNQLFETDEYKMSSADTKASMMEDIWSYSVKRGKKNINDGVNLDKWMTAGEAKKDMVGAVIEKAISDNRGEYIKTRGEEITKSLQDNDFTTTETLIEDLRDKANASDKEIRDIVSDYYRPLYYEAYASDDDDTMDDIEDILGDLDIGYKSSTFKSWQTNAKGKYMLNEDDEDEESRDYGWLNN